MNTKSSVSQGCCRQRWPRGFAPMSGGVPALVVFCLGLLSAAAQVNMLTNPGFETGDLTGWDTASALRGGGSVLIADPTQAHSGNYCVSNYNLTAGWTDIYQGDAMGPYSTGVSLPINDADFYQMAAWVKVPGASPANPQGITLRYRFDPSGNRVDVGAQTLTDSNWTLLQSPWLSVAGGQIASGDAFMDYWEVHSLNNSVPFLADDCAMYQSPPLAISGQVVDGSGAGLDGATVVAASPFYTSASTTTAGGGHYTLTVAPGTYVVSASLALYSSNSTNAPPLSTADVTAPTLPLIALPTVNLSGKLFDATSGSPVALGGVSVQAQVGGSTVTSAPTAADGSYSMAVLVGSPVTLSVGGAWLIASIPQTFTPTNPTPITGLDIQVRAIPAASSLLFSLVTDGLPQSGPAGNWLTVGQPAESVVPAGVPFVPVGTPGTANGFPTVPMVQELGGVKMVRNYAVNSTFFRLEDPAVSGNAYSSPIPINGATIVLAAQPVRVPGISQPWFSIVDIFYAQLCFGIMNDSGEVCVKINDTANNTYTLPASTAIPTNQTTILSLVVQPSGMFTVYSNGISIYTDTATLSSGAYTELTPGVPGSYADYINIGKNNPDGWPCYNGYIGDVFVYTNALADADREALEANLISRFITNAKLGYTIMASAGPNGSISPAGAVAAVQGYDKTFTITANPGYIVGNVLVDGVSVGLVTSYTFPSVSANHSIAASFVALPPQAITASAGTNGTISPSGTISVAAGASQTFVMTPTSGYAVSSVVVDGVSQGEIYSYTFPFVIAPHTISVTFRALSMNIPRADQLIFAAVANALPGDGNALTSWPTYVPAGQALAVAGGAPTSVVGIGGVGNNIWESNARATGDALRYTGLGGTNGTYTSAIPCSGATIIAVAAPNTGLGNDGWDSLVSVFYNQLALDVRDDTGAVQVQVNGALYAPGAQIPSQQPTVLSLVVEPGGGYSVYAKGVLIMSGPSSALTSLVPGIAGTYADFIEIGRDGVDGWSSFNGNIGDVFVYKTALTDAERQQVENIEMNKYAIPLPPTYQWAGPNNGTWSRPANWQDTVPGVGNLAVFSASNTAGAAVQLDTDASVAGLAFNNLVPNTTIASTLGHTLTLDDGTLTDLAPLYSEGGGTDTVSAAVNAVVGINKTGSGAVVLSGAVTIGSDVTVNPALTVSGTGSELVLAGPTTLAMGAGTEVTGNGTLTISGSLNSGSADIIIAQNNTPGQVILSGSGGWTNTGSGNFVVGNDQPGAVGTVTVNDNAALDLSGMNFGALNVAVGWNGGSAGSIVQNGGTLITMPLGNSWIYEAGPGVILGGWNSTPCYAEYDLNGGILITPNIYNVNNNGKSLVAPNGTAIFKFNGGVIQATQDDSSDPQVMTEGSTNLMGNLTHAWVQAGGAQINTAGFNCGINQSLEHDAALGVTLDGGLAKQGLGTLALYQPSTYTGPTRVQSGVLACAISAALGGGAVDITTGGKLELDYTGTRAISQLTFDGGALQAGGTYGATGSGAAHIDNAHFAGTGTVTVSLGAPVLSVADLSFAAGGVPQFTFNTLAGYKYRLVYNEDLPSTTWSPVISPPNNPAPDGWSATSTGAAMTITDPGAAGRPHRFYRLEVATP